MQYTVEKRMRLSLHRPCATGIRWEFSDWSAKDRFSFGNGPEVWATGPAPCIHDSTNHQPAAEGGMSQASGSTLCRPTFGTFCGRL